MSSLVINGVTVFSVSPSAESSAKPQPQAAPSWDTHRLVDGHWVPKGTPAPTQHALIRQGQPVGKPRPIGFQPPSGRVTVDQAMAQADAVPMRCLSGRKEYLAAIRQAAGKALSKGTDQEACTMIGRGRLGSRKDNISGLQWLLWRYERAALT